MAKESASGSIMRRRRLRMFVAIFLVAALVVGFFLGFFLAGGQKSAARLIEEGRDAFNAGNYRDAAGKFEEALKQEPDSVEALLGLGQSLVLGGSPGEGVVRLKRALELDPENPNRAAIEQLIQQAGGQ